MVYNRHHNMRKTLTIILALVAFGGLKPLLGQSFTVGVLQYVRPYYYSDTNFVVVTGPTSPDISGHVTIPSTITGSYYDMDQQEVITRSFQVIGIGENAFVGCTNLTSVSIPNSVIYIGENAFSDCTNLDVLIVPSTVTSIGQGAFMNVRHVVYSGTATESRRTQWGALHLARAYENGLFYADTSKTVLNGADSTVTNLVIPSSVRCVADGAFTNNTSITSLTIPPTVDTIYVGAFACPNLTTLVYNGSGVTSIFSSYSFGIGIFTALGEGEYNSESSTYTLDTIRANITNLTFGSNVTAIPDFFMSGMSNLTSLTIPASIDTIGEYAFHGTGLTSLTIPEGVKYIGNRAFLCPNLTTLTYNAQRCNFGYRVFYAINCTGNYDNRICDTIGAISSLTIGNSVLSIPSEFMSNMRTLTSVTIPASVKKIGGSAFAGTRLTSVTIPATVDTIEYHAFSSIPTLETIYYNATNAYHSSTESSPFYRKVCQWVWDDAAQTEIRICSEAPQLHVFIGSNVRSLPSTIFARLPIAHITLPDSLQTVGAGAFEYCDSLTSVAIPDAVASIGSDAFAGCVNLQTVTIGNGVTTIDNRAFRQAPIRRLTIGSNVASIGAEAFDAMTNPDTIFMLPAVPPTIMVSTFQNMPTNARIMVPCGTLQDYQDANYWSAFTRMAEDPSCYTLITVGSNDLNKGTVTGGGRYSQGSVATLSALAKKDFAFAGWADGNNDNPRLVLVSGDASYTANFSAMTGGVVHDTVTVTLRDTVTVTLRDTVFVGDGDTLIVYRDVHDTVYITNTIHDTVYITDTVYVGVDDVKTVDVKLYQQGGDVVVEGAEGQPVAVYDAVGRLLATRRDTYGPVRFAAPATGTYLVRVGSAAARRIVVVR